MAVTVAAAVGVAVATARPWLWASPWLWPSAAAVAVAVGATVAMGGVAILASATAVGGGAVPGVAGDANPAVGVGAGAGPPPSQAATTSVRAVARAAAARRERVKRNVQLRQADSNRRTPWTLCPPAERWSRSRCAPRSGPRPHGYSPPSAAVRARRAAATPTLRSRAAGRNRSGPLGCARENASLVLLREGSSEDKKFQAVSCAQCGYTEIHRGNTSALANIFDLFTG